MSPQHQLPQFSTIDPITFPKRLGDLLEKNLAAIDALLAPGQAYTWDNVMTPLEVMDDALERFWSPLSHLHAVVNSKELRTSYKACLPLLSAYESKIGHNRALYEAIAAIDAAALNATQQKILTDSLLDFRLSGVALSAEKKVRFEAISARLSECGDWFENNILDAGQAFYYTIEDESRLAGLPEHAVDTARELAVEKGVSGWVFNLEMPSYLAIIMYAEDRALREIFYEAYVTRASDKGPHAGQFDNTAGMNEILALRHEKAQLLGFTDYSHLSLATKMAKDPSEVMGFLTDLAQRAHSKAVLEYHDLAQYGEEQLKTTPVQPWDIAYFSEKKRQSCFDLSQEDLRVYFPEQQVLKGLIAILEKLYGIHLDVLDGMETWHPDVACYRLTDENGGLRGYLYADWFARPNKRGGAWMDSLQSRRVGADGQVQVPIATLTCNFAKASANKPAMLSHDEVITLFHEMGHCLQHILTQVDYLGASGINGVEWDAVELPSQFFENWCWEREALNLLTAHVDTGETLPFHWYEKMIAAKNFQSAMGMMRQLEFSLFDFRMHSEYASDRPDFIQAILSDVRAQTMVTPLATYNRFQHSFSHIFGGGYAAGYYSYKWAEVLSSDAFARFEEEGVFNPKTGRDFLHTILEVGGSVTAKEAFIDFRGQPATIDALLRHNGL